MTLSRAIRRSFEEPIDKNRLRPPQILSLRGRQQCLDQRQQQEAAAPLFSSSSSNNVLLQFYLKRGYFRAAYDLFTSIHKDVQSWNLMISVFARLENNAEAFYFFFQMMQESIIPNRFVFGSILSACANNHTMTLQGKWMHALVQAGQYTNDVVIQTALVNMYGKLGDVVTAHTIFNDNQKQDIALWNAMLSAYSQHGLCKETLVLMAFMQQQAVLPNDITYVAMLSACSDDSFLLKCKQLHACIQTIQDNLSIIIGTALITAYSKCNDLNSTHDIFSTMSQHDLVLWNAMIAGCVRNQNCEDAFQLLSQLQHEGVIPNKITCTCLLEACITYRHFGKCKIIHTLMAGLRLEFDTAVGAALVNMYSECGSLGDALHHFERMPKQDVMLYNTMIAAFVKYKQVTDVMKLYLLMEKEGISPDRVTFITVLPSFVTKLDLALGRQVHGHATRSGLDLDLAIANALVNMYGKCGSFEDAVVVFGAMPCHDSTTFVNMLSSYTNQASLFEGKKLHACMNTSGMEVNVNVGNALINMYGKCGGLEDAWGVFKNMQQRNDVTWSSMITAYAQHGNAREVLSLFAQMHTESLTIENAAYVSVLNACSHSGLWDEACVCFLSIINRRGAHDVEHYNCLIDLLGRCGQLGDAEDLLNAMPFQPTSVSWLALLGACQIHFDVERGDHIALHILELDPNDVIAYVILSNIYVTM